MALDLTDAEVLRESLDDPTRFQAIYERHLETIHRYLRSRVGDGLAEDLAAEVFVRAFRGRARYDAQYPTAGPWLFGIANNLIGDQRRAERQRLKTLERLAQTPPARQSIASDEAIFQVMLSPELVRAVRKLPAGDRDALLLVAWGELSYEETARALGIPVGTVRSRIARARSGLKRTLGVDVRPSSVRVASGDHHA